MNRPASLKHGAGFVWLAAAGRTPPGLTEADCRGDGVCAYGSGFSLRFNPRQPRQGVRSIRAKSALTLPSFGGSRRRFIEGIGRDMQTRLLNPFRP